MARYLICVLSLLMRTGIQVWWSSFAHEDENDYIWGWCNNNVGSTWITMNSKVSSHLVHSHWNYHIRNKHLCSLGHCITGSLCYSSLPKLIQLLRPKHTWTVQIKPHLQTCFAWSLQCWSTQYFICLLNFYLDVNI